MHGGLQEGMQSTLKTEVSDLGLHQQPKTMNTRHAGAMGSTDGPVAEACSS